MAVVEARVARDKERMQTSASVKDVAAFEQELAALAKRQSDLEDIELAVMETVDEKAKALSDARAQLDAVDAKIAEASAARDAALAGLDGEKAAGRRRARGPRRALARRPPGALREAARPLRRRRVPPARRRLERQRCRPELVRHDGGARRGPG